jgi:hypothetical protein
MLQRTTAFHTLICQRHPTPSCGGLVPTAERTLDPARMLMGELDARPGIRDRPRPDSPRHPRSLRRIHGHNRARPPKRGSRPYGAAAHRPRAATRPQELRSRNCCDKWAPCNLEPRPWAKMQAPGSSPPRAHILQHSSQFTANQCVCQPSPRERCWMAVSRCRLTSAPRE